MQTENKPHPQRAAIWLLIVIAGVAALAANFWYQHSRPAQKMHSENKK